MKNLIVAFAAATLLTGCSTSENAPLIFGTSRVVGVSVGASAAGTVPEVTVGFKDLNIAHVPTIFLDPNGEHGLIQGLDDFPNGAGVLRKGDAYSTFGQFALDSGATGVALGTFFSTGVSARRISEGFACQVSKGTLNICSQRPHF